ncbi:uncharacterized protein BCR38DRAFT_192676 [Pseudomassariella vexata]|uniref:Uncharacterized protein n=1 Tax=Pseudomassariella vexata TaxID=1141098 RepID=A0A1Y2E120_9PEZI|nr:uncharacterized protein BCR38DRAFT_192676 [Pseudomassariella vexata]ORY65177.1 hypothetical protein BCR38DRAFT_192676 [Pseudomassariella vexata]
MGASFIIDVMKPRCTRSSWSAMVVYVAGKDKLVVQGIKNSRVAECSIMPKSHGGHTQIPAYGISGKCSDFIKAAWGLSGSSSKHRSA